MYNVQSLSLQEKIKKKAVKRDDVHEKIVQKRIIDEPDLIAVEAIYHHDCNVSFSAVMFYTSEQKQKGMTQSERYS